MGRCRSCRPRTVGNPRPNGPRSAGRHTRRMDPPPQPASPAHSPGPACAECGYDLRGVEPGDTCPECGRARAIGLTRREAVLVGVRVVAVCLVLNSLLLLDTLAWLAIDSLVALLTGGPSVASGVADPTFFVLQAAPLGVRVALAALLWWQSRRLAKRLVPHDGPVFAGTGPAAADLLSVGADPRGRHARNLRRSRAAGPAGPEPLARHAAAAVRRPHRRGRRAACLGRGPRPGPPAAPPPKCGPGVGG